MLKFDKKAIRLLISILAESLKERSSLFIVRYIYNKNPLDSIVAILKYSRSLYKTIIYLY